MSQNLKLRTIVLAHLEGAQQPVNVGACKELWATFRETLTMSLQGKADKYDVQILAEIKALSGRCIEDKRKRMGLTQERLAARVGIGARWLREIESGNPKPSLEDHLRCARGVGMGTAYLFIPLLFLEHRVKFEPHLVGDMDDLEERCIDFIGDYCVERVAVGVRRPPASDRDN